MSAARHGMSFAGFEFGPYLDCNPRRPLLPPVSVSSEPVPGGDGSRFRAARLDELTIQVDASLRARGAADVAELRHMLAAALAAREPSPLVLPDDPRRYYMAVLDGSTDLDRLWDGGAATLSFRACDPVAYGERRRARVSGTGAARIKVGGTYRTSPVVTATPPRGSSWRMTDVDTGAFLEVRAAFDGSARLVVDSAARRCTLNGAPADPYVTLESDYPEFEPGLRSLKLSGGSAEIEWDERWL